MDVGFATVFASVTGGVALIVAQLLSFRKENRKDHAIVAERLTQIHNSVERVETKVDEHIVDHATGMV